jgi:hypothetical protein
MAEATRMYTRATGYPHASRYTRAQPHPLHARDFFHAHRRAR